MRGRQAMVARRTAVTELACGCGVQRGSAAASTRRWPGVMFAIEELSRPPEQSRQTPIVSAICSPAWSRIRLRNEPTFGVIVSRDRTSRCWDGPSRPLPCVASGRAFRSLRLLIMSLGGESRGCINPLARRHRPVRRCCRVGRRGIGVTTKERRSEVDTTSHPSVLEAVSASPGVCVSRCVATGLSTWSGV